MILAVEVCKVSFFILYILGNSGGSKGNSWAFPPNLCALMEKLPKKLIRFEQQEGLKQ